MTRQEALDLAAERGHGMEKVTLHDPAPYLTWACEECGARVVIFATTVYGSALERDCSGPAAA